MAASLGGAYTTSMQSPAFSDPEPMGWASLDEQPYMDGYAGGAWVCGANKAWGIMQAGNPSNSHYCTSCPPCEVDRFQTQLMVRDANPPCCTTESYQYGTNWPYEFAGGSTCPKGPELPLFQDLYHVRNYPAQDIPIATPFNPWYL